MDRFVLKKIILKNDLLDEKRLNEIESLSINSNEALLDTILNGKYTTEGVIMPLVAEYLGEEWFDLDENSQELDSQYYNQLTNETQQFTEILPLFCRDDFIFIGISNPMKTELLDHLNVETDWNLKTVLLAQSKIDSIRKIFQDKVDLENFDRMEIDSGSDDKSIEDIANEAPVIKRVNLIIMQAISMGVSDIHIDPYETEAIVRYRIDGVLDEHARYPKSLYPAIISRIKIMADLNIAERRIPQDGRISMNVMKKSYDLRVATIPVLHGEGVVMRILDKSGSLVSLEQIGLDKEKLAIFKKQIALPYGIILVTGPTGSGKTTTLNAAIMSIKHGKKKIITIEDPVEYEMSGVTQIHVNSKVGLTFAAGLRSILRLDPDIVMVGEIRDNETGEIAIRTALTGHLVFSTLHTNDAPSAVTRLIDMGIEPFLISSSVNAILAQRLIRKVCKNCAELEKPNAADEVLFEDSGTKILKKFLHAKGCDKCHNTGYKGRTGIIEFLEMNDAIRGLANKRVSTDQIREEAERSGMKTMRSDGIEKVINGITTSDEILRVTQEN
jgi:general secretion pathway protein E